MSENEKKLSDKEFEDIVNLYRECGRWSPTLAREARRARKREAELDEQLNQIADWILTSIFTPERDK